MKQYLLLLLLTLCLPISSQTLEKTAVFDFSNPTSLNPSITPSDESGIGVRVYSTVFKAGAVTLSFSDAVQTGGYAYLMTNINEYQGTTSYSLKFGQGTLVNFNSTGNAVIKKIQISENSITGDTYLSQTSPGSLIGKTWTCGDNNNVTAVSFRNGGVASYWETVTVTYTALQNQLTPSSVSPSEGAEVKSFSSMSLRFADNMTVVKTSGITITGTSISGSKSLSASASGKYVYLSLPAGEVLGSDGDYTVTIPAGCFQDAEGYCNKALTYTFKVREDRNTFNVLSVVPENGSTVEKLEFPITLTFPAEETSYIGYVDESTTLYLYRSGVNSPIAQVKAVKGDNGVVQLQVQGQVTTFTTDGTYSLKFNEKMVYDQLYGTEFAHYNNAVNLSYTVVDPLKTLKTQVATLKAQIGMGIGYPATDSDAAQKLAAVTAADATPTEQELNDAITAFYAETNVVMPSPGKWYHIIGVNSVDSKVYVGYANGQSSVVTSASQAAAFQLSKNDDGTYNFMTADGKYLMVLSQTGKVASEKGTTASSLTVSKMLMDGIDDKQLLGKFTIAGWLGNDDNGNDLGRSTAAIDYTTKTVAQTPTTEFYFSTAQSSAFIFEETTDPTYVEPVTPTASLSPTSVTFGVTTTATLTINGVTTVLLKDASKAYFSTDAAGQSKVSTTGSILTKTGGNTFTVSLAGLAVGTYYLQVPVGTFEYGQNTDPVNDVAFKQSITIVEPVSYFNTTYSAYSCPKVEIAHGDPVKDEFLNGLVIEARVPGFYSDLIPDPTKEVKIVNAYNLTVVGRGHFEAYTNFARDYPADAADGYKAIILVMDEPILPGSLQDAPDIYSYDIPEATFGDKKFGEYLSGKAGVKKSDCIVNKKTMGPNFHVDNRAATAINGISADVEQGEQRVYDLNGRRVAEPVKGGIYIINGRKVLVK